MRTCIAIPVTLHQPGPTRRSPHRVIAGRLLGEMHARGTVHHYRVEGSCGVLNLAPPDWIAPECRVEVSNACITARVADPAPRRMSEETENSDLRLRRLIHRVAAALELDDGFREPAQPEGVA